MQLFSRLVKEINELSKGMQALTTQADINRQPRRSQEPPMPFIAAPAAALATGDLLDSGPGQFSYPEGVAVDSAGNIIMADSNNNQVQQFGPDGSFICA
jgi:hypothetical protein